MRKPVFRGLRPVKTYTGSALEASSSLEILGIVSTGIILSTSI